MVRHACLARTVPRRAQEHRLENLVVSGGRLPHPSEVSRQEANRLGLHRNGRVPDHRVLFGLEASDEAFTLTLGTSVDWDLTKKLELELDYTIQFSLEDIEDFYFKLSITFSYELGSILDLDISFYWDYVGEPRANPDGTFPERSDFKLVVSVSWEF